MNVVADHLGGERVGGDPLCWYPELWDWILETQTIGSVIDIGCGEGHALSYFADQGCDVHGVEGVPQPSVLIVEHDYTLGPYLPARPYDLAWSCEFVEHVEEQFVANFLATFACADLVLMTHAVPDQRGWHHVNCRDDEYWIDQLATVGHVYDAELTEQTRALAHSYYERSGLAFRCEA